MVSEIRSKDELIALLIDHDGVGDGTHPITDPTWPLQALIMQRPKGHVFTKHTHKDMERTVATLQEAVLVTKGKLGVTVCDKSGNDLGRYDVAEGQCLFLVNGGYKLEVLDDVRFFEFKNGPYADDKLDL